MAKSAPARLSVPEAARLFNLLGDEDRLRLVLHLARHGETSVTTLCEALDMSRAFLNHRLRVLRLSGVVRNRREGGNRIYSLHSPGARHLLALID
jgi:DNA-binding transcriptional ArsR family regulator